MSKKQMPLNQVLNTIATVQGVLSSKNFVFND